MGNTQSRTRSTPNSMSSARIPNRNTTTSSTAQQLRDFVKSQVKTESLRRAGNQGADPWGDMDELIPSRVQQIQQQFSPFSGNGGMTGGFGAGGGLVAGQEPEEREPLLGGELPAFLTQPLTLLNRSSGNNQNNGEGGGENPDGVSGQQLNYEIVYYAPVYESTSTREVINCCEDCCEDVCENCCLNCCLDCSRITEFLKPNQWNEKTGKTDNQSNNEPLITPSTTSDDLFSRNTTIGNISI